MFSQGAKPPRTPRKRRGPGPLIFWGALGPCDSKKNSGRRSPGTLFSLQRRPEFFSSGALGPHIWGALGPPYGGPWAPPAIFTTV